MRPSHRRRWLLGALAAAAGWCLWPRGQPGGSPFGGGAARVRPEMALAFLRSAPGPSANPADAAPPDPDAARLDLIRAGLREWLRASRPIVRSQGYDKDGQDGLENNLLSLVTPQNAAAVLLSLSPREMDSPLAITATQRWLEADPASAARWIASCPFATDDQAWAVARQAVTDGPLMAELCAGPSSPWKDRFLHYASLEVLTVDSAEAERLAQRMKPGETRSELLRQIAAAPTRE